MTYTLANLIYLTAREIGGDVVREGKATGGSTTTIIDTLRRTETDDYWNNGLAVILYDSGGAGAAPQGEYSIITDFTNSTSLLTMEAMTVAVAAGDRYAVIKGRYELDEPLMSSINRAIMAVGRIPLVDVSLTTAGDQTEYTLPAAASLDLRQVYIQSVTTDSDNNEWVELFSWNVFPAATGTAHTLWFPYQTASGCVLKLVYMDMHPDLYLFSSKLNQNIDPRRIIYRAAQYCLEWRMDKTRTPEYERTWNRLMKVADQMDALYPVSVPRRPVDCLVLSRLDSCDWGTSTPRE